MNIEEFIKWWEGFAAAVDPKDVTEAQWNTLRQKINTLKIDKPIEIKITPSSPEPVPVTLPYNDWWNRRIGKPKDTFPYEPNPIWCNTDTPQGVPRVGTREGFGTLEK